MSGPLGWAAGPVPSRGPELRLPASCQQLQGHRLTRPPPRSQEGLLRPAGLWLLPGALGKGAQVPTPSPSAGSFSPGAGGLGPRQHRSWEWLLRMSSIQVGSRVSILQGTRGWAWFCGGERVPAGQCREGPASLSPLRGASWELGSGGSTHRGLPLAGQPESWLWVHSEPALPLGPREKP